MAGRQATQHTFITLDSSIAVKQDVTRSAGLAEQVLFHSMRS